MPSEGLNFIADKAIELTLELYKAPVCVPSCRLVLTAGLKLQGAH